MGPIKDAHSLAGITSEHCQVIALFEISSEDCPEVHSPGVGVMSDPGAVKVPRGLYWEFFDRDHLHEGPLVPR